eukprot:tig00001278_g7987.t1
MNKGKGTEKLAESQGLLPPGVMSDEPSAPSTDAAEGSSSARSSARERRVTGVSNSMAGAPPVSFAPGFATDEPEDAAAAAMGVPAEVPLPGAPPEEAEQPEVALAQVPEVPFVQVPPAMASARGTPQHSARGTPAPQSGRGTPDERPPSRPASRPQSARSGPRPPSAPGSARGEAPGEGRVETPAPAAGASSERAETPGNPAGGEEDDAVADALLAAMMPKQEALRGSAERPPLPSAGSMLGGSMAGSMVRQRPSIVSESRARIIAPASPAPFPFSNIEAVGTPSSTIVRSSMPKRSRLYETFVEQALSEEPLREEDDVPGPPADLLEGYLAEIARLREGMVASVIRPHHEIFPSEAVPETVVVGSISAEAAAEQDRLLHKQRLELEERENRRMNAIAGRQKEARASVRSTFDALFARHKALEGLRLQKDRERQANIRQAFRKAESQLREALIRRKAEVRIHYGQLRFSRDKYGGIKSRRYKLDWTSAPQPVEVNLHMLRAVRDKLPAGDYCILVSCYDKLGGYPLWWSNLIGKETFGSTLPFHHTGRWDASEMRVEQKVYTVCPSKADMKATMVFVFELYLLQGPQCPTDKVVAWGAFPMYNPALDVVNGRFRVPLLRGEVDPEVDTHRKYERAYYKDLDRWLCNMYFEVVPLSRYVKGHKEYEVQLALSQETLGFGPDKTREPVPLDQLGNLTNVPEEKADGEEGEEGEKAEGEGEGNEGEGVEAAPRIKTAAELLEEAEAAGEADIERGIQNSFKFGAASTMSASFQSVIAAKGGEVSAKRRPKDYRDKDKSGASMGVEEPGMTFVVHGQERNFKVKRHEETMVGSTEELENYKFEVRNAGVGSVIPVRRPVYIWRELVCEMKQWRNPAWWITMVLLLFCLWARIFIYYAGQYVVFSVMRVQPLKFDVWAFDVTVEFPPYETLSQDFVYGMSVAGCLTNFAFFLVIVVISFAMVKLFDTQMDMWSRLVACYGVAAVLDPILILIVDCARQKWTYGTAFMFYNFYRAREKNGVIGVFAIVVIDAWLIGISFLLLVFFFTQVYMSGQMNDVYHRLNGDWSHFFVPMDHELSAKDLKTICERAEKWRGDGGARRKIAVQEYVTTDEKDKRFKEVSTHLVIATVGLDGKTEVHRQFLRYPDGAICEIYGPVEQLTKALMSLEAKANVAAAALAFKRAATFNKKIRPATDLLADASPTVADGEAGFEAAVTGGGAGSPAQGATLRSVKIAEPEEGAGAGTGLSPRKWGAAAALRSSLKAPKGKAPGGTGQVAPEEAAAARLKAEAIEREPIAGITPLLKNRGGKGKNRVAPNDEY